MANKMNQLEMFIEVLSRNGIDYSVKANNKYLTVTFKANDGTHHKDFYHNGKQVSSYRAM